jgi:hypothetical protein
MTEHVIDAEVIDDHGTDLAVTTPAASATLFRTDDPVEVVERASRVADALKGVLDRQGLTATIGGKRHVLVEGWTTLGAMVGVTAVPVHTAPLDGDAPSGKTFGYEARVEARTLDGRVIGAADAMCTRAESRWRSADDYAIRSMAQTRATSKALRGPLGFVVTLAGYVATPAEEIPVDPAPTPAPTGPPVTAEQVALIREAYATLGWTPQKLTMEMVAAGLVDTSGDSLAAVVERLTVPQAEAVMRTLKAELDAKATA